MASYNSGLSDFAVLSSVVLNICFGTAFYFAERMVQESLGFWDSIWWAMVTMTTVGYGDYAPKTEIGRIVAVFIMFSGIGLIAIVTATISSVFITKKIMEGKGLGNITSNNHTLICGWNSNINNLISSLIEKEKKCEWGCDQIFVYTPW